jgi:hypothetical protein
MGERDQEASNHDQLFACTSSHVSAAEPTLRAKRGRRVKTRPCIPPTISAQTLGSDEGIEAVLHQADATYDTGHFGHEAIRLDAFSVSQLREFFELLDRWDREGAYDSKTV